MKRAPPLACLVLLWGGGAFACAPPPPPIRDITANRFYIDAQNSIADPVLLEKRRLSVKPLETFRSDLARLSSRALKGDAVAGACVGQWLASWAKGRALLGRMSERQAEYDRKWMLAGFSISYLKAKPQISAADRAVIARWLEEVADVASHFFEQPGRRRNNHYYWLGLAVGASALASGNTAHARFARQVFTDALRDISPEGDLPLETARAGKALAYHNFSLHPLIMLAEIGAQRGEDWYRLENGAIHRLVAFTLAQARDSSRLATLAGKQQEAFDSAKALVWLPFYARRFPQRVVAYADYTKNPYQTGMSGGDMVALAKAWIP